MNVFASREAKLRERGNPEDMRTEGATKASFYKVSKALRAACMLDCFSLSATPRGSQ